MDPTRRIRWIAAAAAATVCVVAGCGRGDRNLWSLDLAPVGPAAAPPARGVDGTWEGDVAMGGIRLRVEADRLTLALKCDPAGGKLSQASARVVVEPGAPGRMRLDGDLAGGDADCGFRFGKGDSFAYRPGPRDTLEIAFAGDSVSRLVRVADAAR